MKSLAALEVSFISIVILVLPHDIEGEESDDTENVFYTKLDSRRLKKFLLEEAAAVWKRPEKKAINVRLDMRCVKL